MPIRSILIVFFIFFLIKGTHGQENLYSPNGGPFTPVGDMHILVVLAGFEKDCDPSSSNYYHSFWPQEIKGQSPCMTSFNGIEELFYPDTSYFNPEAQDHSLSNFFYQSSQNTPNKKPFRVTADIFPERINIPGNSPDNRKVFELIEEKFPDFDWSKYDNRTNNPDFSFDNSQSEPDSIIDYIVVIWRNPGLSGYASTSSYNFNQVVGNSTVTYQINHKSGFTINGSMFHLPGIRGIFLHELAHSLYNCPHLFGVNGVCGSYFHASTGWGMIKFGEIFSTPNAWESWYLGWIELPKNRDLKNISANGTYILDDFMTTGDAMRIKIPHTNQYLWLENHAGKNTFDNRDVFFEDAFGNPIPEVEKGLFMYVENLSDNRNTIISALSPKYANGIKMMHSEGNYDYKIKEITEAPEIWNNKVANFTLSAPNPTGAHNHLTYIRHDFEIDEGEEIIYKDFTNNRCQNKDCQSNEHLPVWKKNDILTYDNLGTNMAFGNKKYEQKCGLSHNPVITNLQRYNKETNTSEPIILHPLSVNVHPKISDGRIKVDIKFDDNKIIKNQKFTGNLLLPEKGLLNASLHIMKGKKLSIEKSGTPDRHTMGEKKEDGYEYPDFINPSILTMTTGSHLIIDDKSKLIIKKGSTLNIEKGATLEIRGKGKLIVENGAWLNVTQGSILKTENTRQLSIGAYSHTGLNPLLKKKETENLSIEEIKQIFSGFN